LTLDIGAFTKTLDSQIQIQMRQGARAFARAALARIPVRTGFAAGSLGNISNPGGAAFALFNQFSRSFFASSNRKPEYYRHGAVKVLKTPTAGRKFATPPDRIFTKEGNKYFFNYRVSIIYFRINEFFSNRFTPSAPWGSFEAGQKAFLEYMQNVGIKRLPKLDSFLVETKVTVLRKVVSKTKVAVQK
jgi:hypothetical protein